MHGDSVVQSYLFLLLSGNKEERSFRLVRRNSSLNIDHIRHVLDWTVDHTILVPGREEQFDSGLDGFEDFRYFLCAKCFHSIVPGNGIHIPWFLSSEAGRRYDQYRMGCLHGISGFHRIAIHSVSPGIFR